MTPESAKVGDLAEQIRGVSFGKSDASAEPLSGYLPVLRTGNITENGLVFNNLIFVPAVFISERQKIRRHDLVIAASSGSLDVVGKAAQALEDYEGSFGAFCKVLRPSAKVHPRYFAHFFKTREYRQKISAAAAGININNLRNQDLDGLDIPLPTLTEQRRIAEVLDKGESLRAKRRAALAQLDLLTQSIFLDLFGDPMANPKSMTVVRLADVATRITDGVHLKPDYTEVGIPFISVKDITTGKLVFDDCKFISAEDHERFTKRCKPERHDILYTKVGATYGRPALIETDRAFSIYVSVCLIKPRKELVHPHFLSAALATSAVKKQADRRIKGIGVPDLHLDQIQNFLIPLPSMNDQHEFARRVSAVEKLKKVQRASLTELDNLFASLQHRAFRGEL